MKTYAESQQEKKFDWFKWLNKKTYTTKDLEDKANLSSSWVTCAVGNQCETLERLCYAPLDLELRLLGVDFCEAICNMRSFHGFNSFEDERLLAIRILEEIEARAAILLKEKS